MPACDFRTKPTENKTTQIKKMTTEEVIEKLKNCIQQQDPEFKKRFLDFSKEPNGKINMRDFKKVGEWISLRFLPAKVQLFSYTNIL